MTNCKYCDKKASSQCSDCGKELCVEHTEKGYSFRSNNPVANCPDCLRKKTKLTKYLSLAMAIVFLLIIAFLILYLNSIFAFF